MNQKLSNAYIAKTASDELGKKIHDAVKSHPIIIHYVRTTKPWDPAYCFGYREFYRKYEKIALGNGAVMKHECKAFFILFNKALKKFFCVKKKKD